VEHPLDDSLDHLRNAFRKAVQSYKPGAIFYDGAVGSSSQRLEKATSRLLSALMGSDVALYLPSRIGNRNMASDLLRVRERVQKGDFNYEHYRTLSRLVIKKASDVKIWSAVFNLIITLSRISPPASIPLVRRDTYHTFLRLAARRRANSPVSRR
jgi:hypothetical protein